MVFAIERSQVAASFVRLMISEAGHWEQLTHEK